MRSATKTTHKKPPLKKLIKMADLSKAELAKLKNAKPAKKVSVSANKDLKKAFRQIDRGYKKKTSPNKSVKAVKAKRG